MRVLKFGAVWCPGCIIMKPLWQEIEKENKWLKNEYYDFDKDKDQVEKWGVDNILPTFIFVTNDNKEILRLHGEINKNKLVEIIMEHKNK